MLSNGNNDRAFNSFEEMPLIPYKILEELLLDTSQRVEDFWKLLKYPTVDALEQPNLTEDEKDSLIWKGDVLEQDYAIFCKPLIGSSLESAKSQTQMRLYRYNTLPLDTYEAIICFELDLITNEKTSMVYYKGMLCERTDLMESFILDIFNGRDLGIGSGSLEYNKELSRACQSLISVNNSKTLYGRSLIMAIRYMGSEVGGMCG